MANKHAIGEADKEARRDAILAAARTLFLDDPRRFPSVAAVAAQAGIAKGTIYLYFATKEDIFTTLLAHEWDELFAVVASCFADRPADPMAQVDLFIGALTEFLENKENFLRLDALGYGVLEANLPVDQVIAFKKRFGEKLAQTGAIVDKALDLPPGRGMELLLRSHALTLGLWQALDYAEPLRSVLKKAEFPLARLRFSDELRRALTEYWRGAL